jgi:hypothetical protein
MRLLVATVVAALLLVVPAAASAAPTKPCKDDKRARCGSVAVPLLRGAPDGGGRKLRVRFRVFPRTDRSKPPLEPIVAAEGGSGYPSIGTADSYLFMLGPMRRRYALIVVDNRGTGSSRFGGPRMTLAMIHVTWHMTTIAFLTVGSALLLSGSVLDGDAARGVGVVAAAAATGFAALAVGLGFASTRSFRTFFRHPAPAALTATAALAWLGVL